jgi:hypothetical protein
MNLLLEAAPGLKALGQLLYVMRHFITEWYNKVTWVLIREALIYSIENN